MIDFISGQFHDVCQFNNAKHTDTMEITLRKYGNSTVAVLPPNVLKALGLSAGQTMNLDTTEDGRVILQRKRKYKLEDLIAQCKTSGQKQSPTQDFDQAKPVGQEVW